MKLNHFHECFNDHSNTNAFIHSFMFKVNRNADILKLCAKEKTAISFPTVQVSYD